MLRLFLILVASACLSGCFVLEELENGDAIIEQHSVGLRQQRNDAAEAEAEALAANPPPGRVPTKPSVGDKLQALWRDALEEERKQLVATRKGGFLAGAAQLREKLPTLSGRLPGYEGKPSKSHLDYADLLEAEVATGEERFAGVLVAHLDGLNAQLGRKDMDPLAEKSFEQWEEERRR